MKNYRIKYLDESYLSLDNYELAFRKPDIQLIHSHQWLEISIVKSGNGVYHVEDRFYEMHRGDVFLFNNIEKHGIYRIDPPEVMKNMVIHFEPSFVYFSEGDFFDYRFLKIFFERTENFENRLDRNNPNTREVGNLLLEIEKEFVEKREGFELAIKVKLLNILVILMRYYGYTNTGENSYLSQKTSIDSVRLLVDYINKNFAEDITLGDLAKMVNMNATYLSALFSKYNGISIWTFLCKTRVSRAMEYLKSSDTSILKIASLCGFNNSSNFNRVFKKISGVSPSEYRSKGSIK